MKKNNDFSTLEKDFIQYCAEGNIDKCKELLKKIPKKQLTPCINTGFHNACINGHTDIAKLLFSRGILLKNTLVAFHNVCLYGHKELVAFLLEKGTDINNEDTGGITGLSFACEKGHKEVVALLLERRANANTVDNEGCTPLQIACENGHKEVVALLLAKEANANTFDNKGFTPLQIACQNKHGKVVELLLDHGANVNAVNNKNDVSALYLACLHGDDSLATLLLNRGAKTTIAGNKRCFTPLYIACEGGHYVLAELLLARGADVNALNTEGYTALHVASQRGHYALAKLLLDNNADIHAKNTHGATALHCACFKNHKEVTELLLARGANVNALNNNMHSPLYSVATSKTEQDEVIELLLKHDADLDTADSKGSTALHIASALGHKKVVVLLLNNGANINAKNKEGLTALHTACNHGQKEIAELLLDTGIDIHARAVTGFTALHFACSNEQKEIAELLLDRGIDIHATTTGGFTALHCACNHGHKEVTELLLDRGINIHAANDSGYTALHCACSNGHKEVTKLLLARGADLNALSQKNHSPLLFASENGHVETVKVLLAENNITVDNRDAMGATPLFRAVANKQEKVVALLLEAGANVNVIGENDFTILYIACDRGCEKIVTLLLKYGADINVSENKKRFTALHIACYKENYEVVKLLLTHGARPRASDKENHELAEPLLNNGININAKEMSLGLTALHFACNRRDIKTVTLLLAHGANVNAVNKNEFTALDLALEQENKELVALLLQAGAEIASLSKKDLDFIRKNKNLRNIVKKVLNLSTLDKSLRNTQIEPKKKRVNAAFIESYFSSVLPKGLKLIIDKQNDFYVLSLVMNEDALENEDITFIRSIFNTECKNIFQGIVDNDCVKIATDVEEPLIQKSKTPYEKITTLKKRYTPAEVQIQFDDKGSFLEISTRHLSLPNTEEGRALWIEAAINDLAKIGVKATKDGKYQCKVPLTSLASSAMNFETPWFYSLLNTLSQRFFAAGEITKLKQGNIAISFLRSKNHEFGTKSAISFSAESVATFLKYALKEMLTLDNLKIRDNLSKTKFAVIIPQSMEEKCLLEAKALSFPIATFVNLLKKIRDFYSLVGLELCWCEESQALGILLFPNAQDTDYIARNLQEKKCDVEITHEKALKLKTIPKADFFKGFFEKEKQRYIQDEEDAAEVERREKEKQERKAKLNAPKAHASGTASSSGRAMMQPMAAAVVPKGKSQQEPNNTYAKVKKAQSAGFERTNGAHVYTNGHKPKNKPSLDEMLRDVKEKFMQIKGRYSKYKDSFYTEYDTLESDKQIIYYQFYLDCFVLFNNWYEYLNSFEKTHQYSHKTPFQGKAEDMMKIRLCLSYSAANNNMGAVLSSIFKEIERVDFDGPNLVSRENILESDAQKKYLTPKERVNLILACFTTLSSYVKGECSSQEQLAKSFRNNPKIFHTAKSLMVASVQLYREFPEETKMAKDLKPYKSLLGQDLIPLRNNIVHNNPVEYTEEEVAGLIIQLYKAGNPTEKKPPVEKPQVKRPQTKKAPLEKAQLRRPLAEITPVQAPPSQILCTVRDDGLHVYTYEEAEGSSSSSWRRPGYR